MSILQGKVVMVTGAGAGIGRATAKVVAAPAAGSCAAQRPPQAYV
jgi:NAD(P)-dependent dehydrogenase (short-subunit alcohol dehydrogenase family)